MLNVYQASPFALYMLHLLSHETTAAVTSPVSGEGPEIRRGDVLGLRVETSV